MLAYFHTLLRVCSQELEKEERRRTVALYMEKKRLEQLDKEKLEQSKKGEDKHRDGTGG